MNFVQAASLYKALHFLYKILKEVILKQAYCVQGNWGTFYVPKDLWVNRSDHSFHSTASNWQ